MKLNPRYLGAVAAAALAVLVPAVLVHRPPVEMDEPRDTERLNRELWEWAKKTPYETALRRVRMSQSASAAETTVPLPTGWSIGPAGAQVPLGTLPFEAVAFAGYVVVVNSGYANGPQSVTVVEPGTGQVVRTLAIDMLFPSARVGIDGDLYLSGGFSKQIYRYNAQFDLVRTYTLPAYTSGLTPVDSEHIAVSYFKGPVAGGLLNPGVLALLNTATGTVEAEATLSGQEPYAAEFTDNHFFVTIPAGNRLMVLDRAFNPVSSLALGQSPQALCRDGERLYVVNSNSDSLSVVDTVNLQVVATIPVRYKKFPLGSAATSCSVDGDRLYVTLANANAVAVVDPVAGRVLGLIPTGWYPTKVLSVEDQLLYVSAKGIQPRRPNPLGSAGGQYVLNLLTGSLGIVPKSKIATSLGAWTAQVLGSSPLPIPRSASSLPIRHIFYIVKENRTYDQVLGDLGRGNGDPSLTLFGRTVTPAHHALAEQFVTLDNFFATGEVSTTGHSITASAYASPYLQLLTSLEYSGRYDGSASVDPSAYSASYLWDSLNARKTPFRVYGELVYFNSLYQIIVERFGVESPLARWQQQSATHKSLSARFKPLNALLARWGSRADTPAKAEQSLRDKRFSAPFSRFFTGDESLEQALSTDPAFRRTVAAFLAHYDFQYRPFDLSYSDLDRVATWKQDFERKVSLNQVEAFQYLTLPNDHTAGNDPAALTPFQYLAQNDAALDVIVRTVAASPIWQDSLILVVEDDAQDGPDHVDATRTLAYAIGPYVRRGAVVSGLYDQVGLVRTVEVLLGLRPLNMTDALAVPLLGVFAPQLDLSPYLSPGPSSDLTPEDLARYEQLTGS